MIWYLVISDKSTISWRIYIFTTMILSWQLMQSNQQGISPPTYFNIQQATRPSWIGLCQDVSRGILPNEWSRQTSGTTCSIRIQRCWTLCIDYIAKTFVLRQRMLSIMNIEHAKCVMSIPACASGFFSGILNYIPKVFLLFG